MNAAIFCPLFLCLYFLLSTSALLLLNNICVINIAQVPTLDNWWLAGLLEYSSQQTWTSSCNIPSALFLQMFMKCLKSIDGFLTAVKNHVGLCNYQRDCSSSRPLLDCPDITSVVDWALKIKYVSISRSHVHSNAGKVKLKFAFPREILIRLSSNFVWLLHACKRSCTKCFLWLWFVLKGRHLTCFLCS